MIVTLERRLERLLVSMVLKIVAAIATRERATSRRGEPMFAHMRCACTTRTRRKTLFVVAAASPKRLGFPRESHL
jgi:hypothetical protein